MEIKGTPLAVELNDLIEISMLLNGDVDKIAAQVTKRVFIVSDYEYSSIDGKEFEVELNDSTNVMNAMKLQNGIIYVYLSISPAFKKFLIIISQFSDISDYLVEDVRKKINSYTDKKQKIQRHTETISSSKEVIYSLYREMVPFRIFSEKEFRIAVRKCKRMRVSCAFTDKHAQIILRNVKCGNEIEGYIKYKKIIVTLDKATLKIIDTEFFFNGFSVKYSDIGLFNKPFHPHVAGYFCFGNREADEEVYRINHSYSFLIDLIVETLMSYNPGGPFIPVRQIIENVGIMKKIYKSMKKMGLTLSSNEEVNRAILERLRTCPNCGSFMDEGVRDCPNNRCQANREYVRHCEVCGERLQPVDWGTNEAYVWMCTNQQCSVFQSAVDDVPCPYCGSSAAVTDNIENYFCVNCRDYFFIENQ